MSSRSAPPPSLQALDEEKIHRLHWRMVVTAGMGFFTDAYDLFVIGIATTLLTPLWHLTPAKMALLNAASLIAAAGGAIIFGWCADKFGRKRMYGLEVLILFIGALLSALSPSFVFLLISRVIVGLGIGGDYPTSAVVASEYSNRKNRGFLVLLVFAMQALGLVVGPSIASLLMWLHIPHELAWRLLLGFGAIPAASVFYLRRRLSETPRFLLRQKPPVEVSRVVSDLTGYEDSQRPPTLAPTLMASPWWQYLLGTAGAWFLLDVAFYGNGVSSLLLMKTMAPQASMLERTLLSALIFLCFAVPGYLCAAKYVDVIGRKPLQMGGFLVMALCYFSMGWMHNLQSHVMLLIILYGLSYFFINFGPNATTFLIPSEIFPTLIRARGHGLSAAWGKAGAFLGAFLLPLVLHRWGFSLTMMLVALVSLLGFFVSFLVPEMKGVSLDAVASPPQN